MSDYERGPYTPPSEPPLSFDPRRPVRGAGPVPITLIVSALVLVGLVGAVAWIYRGGVRHPDQAPPSVGAPLGAIKGPAPADAASNDATAGLVIYKTGGNSAEAANAVAPTLAPPPEQPQPRAVVTAAPTPQPAPLKVAAAKPAPTIASLADAAAAKPPKAPTARAAVKPVAATPALAAAPGAGWVQIGAFSSSALAEKGWNDIARLAPAAMAGKGKKVETVTKDGTLFYRTYVTGFASHADAQAFCAKLKAAGKSCLVK